MARSDITALDATALIAALAGRRIGSEELLRVAIARKEAIDPKVRAVAAMDLDRAFERARAIDELRVKGENPGPLAGLPMTVKDSLDVDGMPASAGVDRYRHRIAQDAEAVAKARRAGAVIWAKTNVPAMASDWQTDNKIVGRTDNPWDVARTPGGSSGGAAAAVSTGITALEIGSDNAGSLRVPAAFCGVFAHKPTFGLVSQRGHVPPEPGALAAADMNVVGPMARSAQDLRLLLSVIADAPVPAKAAPAELTGLKVGLWLDEPAFALDPQVRQAIETLGRALAAAGAEVRPIRLLVDADTLIATYALLLEAAASGDLSDGQRRWAERLRTPAKIATALGAGPLSWAGAQLGRGARHHEWLAANEDRARLAAHVHKAFEEVAVVIAPAAPVAAFPHDPKRRKLTLSDGSKVRYMSLLHWSALASALGLPATSVPAGLTPGGLPVGAQIIGPRGADSKTLAVAQAIDELIGGYRAPPILEL